MFDKPKEIRRRHIFERRKTLDEDTPKRFFRRKSDKSKGHKFQSTALRTDIDIDENEFFGQIRVADPKLASKTRSTPFLYFSE
jgi:hypothetical protein